MTDDPYTLFISDRATLHTSLHHELSCRLSEAGYDVGPMLWTCGGRGGQPFGTAEEIRQKWQEAFTRAGITRIDQAYCNRRMGHWFKVWPRPGDCKKDHPSADSAQ